MLIKAQEPVTASEANRYDLFSQVSGAVDDLAGVARVPGCRCGSVGKSPVMIHGEADQIRMAVRKMVENAIVYSHPGGAVGVSVALSSDRRTPWCVSSIMARACRRLICLSLRTVLPRFQPERAHGRRHRSGIGDRPACGARPSRRCDGVERSRAGQHVHAVAAGGGLIRLSCRDAGNPSGRECSHTSIMTPMTSPAAHMMSNCSTSSPHASSIALTISATDHNAASRTSCAGRREPVSVPACVLQD